MRIIVYSLLLLVLTIKSISGQEDNDLSEIIFNAKINTVKTDNVLFTDKMLCNLPLILKDTSLCKARLLEAKGFEKNIFILIKFADVNFPELIKLNKDVLNNKELLKSKIGEIYYSEFVIAYSITRNRFYKIKGFINNEFELFYFDYTLGVGSLEKENFSNKNEFIKNYYIEGIDLDCLYETVFSKKKTSYKNYPCLEPNFSRMLISNNMPFHR